MTPAERLVRLCLTWLPPHLRDWGEAMAREAGSIPGSLRSLLFALGCAAFALRVGVTTRVRARLHSAGPEESHDRGTSVRGIGEPRRFTLLCAFASTALGLVHLGSSGAPHEMLVMNAMAFAAGLVVVFPLLRREPADRSFFGLVSMGTGAVLLLTAVFGDHASGASRWLSIGQIVVQPSLILLPLIIASFARTQDTRTAFGITMAAIALALQPDRAMAGALLAGLSAKMVFARNPHTLFCVTAAGLAFTITWLRPEVVPITPHVDRSLQMAFSNGMLSGLSVWVGVFVLVLPAVFGIIRHGYDRAAHAALGATWLTLLAAALVGDFSPPLVGYGGSAIVGYILAALALPRSRTISRITVEVPRFEIGDPDRGALRLVSNA